MRFSDDGESVRIPGGSPRMWATARAGTRTVTVDPVDKTSMETCSRSVTWLLGALHRLQSRIGEAVDAFDVHALRSNLWRFRKLIDQYRDAFRAVHKPSIPRFNGVPVLSFHECVAELCGQRDRYLWSVVPFTVDDHATEDEFIADGSRFIQENTPQFRFPDSMSDIDTLELDRLVEIEYLRAIGSEPQGKIPFPPGGSRPTEEQMQSLRTAIEKLGKTATTKLIGNWLGNNSLGMSR